MSLCLLSPLFFLWRFNGPVKFPLMELDFSKVLCSASSAFPGETFQPGGERILKSRGACQQENGLPPPFLPPREFASRQGMTNANFVGLNPIFFSVIGRKRVLPILAGWNPVWSYFYPFDRFFSLPLLSSLP